MITVDPGLGGTGWATWRARKLQECGVITTPREGTLRGRALEIAEQLLTRASLNQSLKLYCEWPAFFDTAGGHMVARKGDLLKLQFLVGVIAGRCYTIRFIPVPVSAWKGQLPKKVVTARVQKILGRKVCEELKIKTHAWDAVGIGLYLLGKL